MLHPFLLKLAAPVKENQVPEFFMLVIEKLDQRQRKGLDPQWSKRRQIQMLLWGGICMGYRIYF